MKENKNNDFEWNQDFEDGKKNNFNNEEKNRKRKKKNGQNWDKVIELGLSFFRKKVMDIASIKLQEAEKKVMTNIDAKISVYKIKIFFWSLLFIGFVLIIYSLFELFFEFVVKHPEWTNMGAGIFFIFIALIMYFVDSLKNKK